MLSCTPFLCYWSIAPFLLSDGSLGWWDGGAPGEDRGVVWIEGHVHLEVTTDEELARHGDGLFGM